MNIKTMTMARSVPMVSFFRIWIKEFKDLSLCDVYVCKRVTMLLEIRRRWSIGTLHYYS
jgi:hypothetical protein